MWYNGEDDPEIAAAIEEERASARSRRHSPKARKGRALPGRRGPPRPGPAPAPPRPPVAAQDGGDPQTFAGWAAAAAAVTFPRRRLPSRREGAREGAGERGRRPRGPRGRAWELRCLPAPPARKVGRGGVRGTGPLSAAGRDATRGGRTPLSGAGQRRGVRGARRAGGNVLRAGAGRVASACRELELGWVGGRAGWLPERCGRRERRRKGLGAQRWPLPRSSAGAREKRNLRSPLRGLIPGCF